MKRLEDETMETYKLRRKAQRLMTKRYLEGKVIWNPAKSGTYVKAVHGRIGTPSENCKNN